MLNQKGFVTPLSLLVLTFALALLAAVSPFIIQEVKFASMNRDAIEAQFAAEAGIKVAAQALHQRNTSWDWAQGTTPQPFVSGTTKTYTVTIRKGDAGNTLDNGYTPETGIDYKVISVGRVGKETKTVGAKVRITGKDDYNLPVDKVLYTRRLTNFLENNQPGKTVKFENGLIVLSTDKPTFVTGTATFKKDMNMVFPNFDYTAYKRKAIPLPAINTKLLRNMNYYHDGDLIINSGIIASDDETQSSTNIIFVEGNIDINGQGIEIRTPCLIISNGSRGVTINDNSFKSQYTSYVVKNKFNAQKNFNGLTGSIIANETNIASKNDVTIYFNTNALVAYQTVLNEFASIPTDAVPLTIYWTKG